jgi:hypothetical protein
MSIRKSLRGGIGRVDTKEFLFDTLRIQERNPETVDGLGPNPSAFVT